MARVACDLSAEGSSVTWLKDNKEVEYGVKYQVTTEGKTQVLLIKDFESADQGVYTCVASDEAESSLNLNLPKGTYAQTNQNIIPCNFNFAFPFAHMNLL